MVSYHCIFDSSWRLSVGVRGKAKGVGRLRIEAESIYEVFTTPRAPISVQRPKLPRKVSVLNIYVAYG